MDEDELLDALRARSAAAEGRTDSAATIAGIGAGGGMVLDLGSLLGSVGDLTGALGRLLEDPLDPDPSLRALVGQVEAGAHTPVPADLPSPATPAAIAAAEAAIGHPLPTLLRRIYLEIANGGVGPGFGLLGIPPGGWGDDRGEDLLDLHRRFTDRPDEVPADRWWWPAHLLPVAYLGDVVYACVDAQRPGAPVFEYDPGDLEWDDDGFPLDEQDALVEVQSTLHAWLQQWVTSA